MDMDMDMDRGIGTGDDSGLGGLGGLGCILYSTKDRRVITNLSLDLYSSIFLDITDRK